MVANASHSLLNALAFDSAGADSKLKCAGFQE